MNTVQNSTSRMSRSESDSLAKLCRQRERLAKVAAGVRAAELRADFQQQLAARYGYDTLPTWKAAHELAAAAVDKVNLAIAASLQELNIPPEFAPELNLRWYDRGENACKHRRAELTRIAESRIAHIEKQARFQIEQASLAVQTQLIAGSLESEEAKAFLESMPSPENLMPMLSMDEIQRKLLRIKAAE